MFVFNVLTTAMFIWRWVHWLRAVNMTDEERIYLQNFVLHTLSIQVPVILAHLVMFVFNVLITAMFIWRWVHWLRALNMTDEERIFLQNFVLHTLSIQVPVILAHLVMFVFNVLTTAMFIWRWVHWLRALNTTDEERILLSKFCSLHSVNTCTCCYCVCV